MTRIELLIMRFRILSRKIPVLMMVAFFSTVTIAQQSDDDDERYKRDRYTGYGSPSDRLYEREGTENNSTFLSEDEYSYGLLSTVADFDQDGKEDIVFFRKLSQEHYILVAVSDYYNPFRWSDRETVLGEFHGIYEIYELGVKRSQKGASFRSLCPSFVLNYTRFTTTLESTERKTLDLGERAITVMQVAEWYSNIIWDDGEYKYFCHFLPDMDEGLQ